MSSQTKRSVREFEGIAPSPQPAPPNTRRWLVEKVTIFAASRGPWRHDKWTRINTSHIRLVCKWWVGEDAIDHFLNQHFAPLLPPNDTTPSQRPKTSIQLITASIQTKLPKLIYDHPVHRRLQFTGTLPSNHPSPERRYLNWQVGLQNCTWWIGCRSSSLYSAFQPSLQLSQFTVWRCYRENYKAINYTYWGPFIFTR